MKIQDRLVNRSSGRFVAFAAGMVVALAMVLVAALVTAGVLHHRPTISTSGATLAATVPHQQAPDAAERNGIYYAALCSGFNDASPDARDRNLQLSGC